MGFTTMAIVSLAGMGLSAYGQYKAGKAQQKAGAAAGAATVQAGLRAQAAADDQAGIADYNAQVADLQAADAVDRGTEQENKFRAGVRGIVGTQRAGIAAGNVDVSFGSAVDVQADAAYLGEQDALQIRTNAAREAWGFQVSAEDLRRRAAVTRKGGAYAAEAAAVEGAAYKQQGADAMTAAKYGIASTLVGGGTSLLATRYGFGGGGGKAAPSFANVTAGGSSTAPIKQYLNPPTLPSRTTASANLNSSTPGA